MGAGPHALWSCIKNWCFLVCNSMTDFRFSAVRLDQTFALQRTFEVSVLKNPCKRNIIYRHCTHCLLNWEIVPRELPHESTNHLSEEEWLQIAITVRYVLRSWGKFLEIWKLFKIELFRIWQLKVPVKAAGFACPLHWDVQWKRPRIRCRSLVQQGFMMQHSPLGYRLSHSTVLSQCLTYCGVFKLME